MPLLTEPSQIIASRSLYGEESVHQLSKTSCFFEKLLNESTVIFLSPGGCPCRIFNSSVKRHRGFVALGGGKHFYSLKCFQSVKKLDFHSSAARLLDFCHIKKVELFGIARLTVTEQNKLYRVRYTAECYSAIAPERLGSCGCRLLFERGYFGFNSSVGEQPYAAQLRKNRVPRILRCLLWISAVYVFAAEILFAFFKTLPVRKNSSLCGAL